MATLTCSAAQANAQAFYTVNGDITRVISYDMSAGGALSAGDVIQFCKVPPGAVIVAVRAAVVEHTGVLTMNIGDGNDVSRYGASVVFSGSAVALTSFPARGLGYSYSALDTVDMKVAAVSAAGASGNMVLAVTYTMQNQT